MRHGESTRKMVARYFLDLKDDSLVGPRGKAVGSGGWKERWETPEKLKNGVRPGGRCCRARQVTSSPGPREREARGRGGWGEATGVHLDGLDVLCVRDGGGSQSHRSLVWGLL